MDAISVSFIHTWECIYMCVHLCRCVCVRVCVMMMIVCVCVCVRVYVCEYIYVYIYIYVCVCVCVCIHKHTYLRIYVYIHIYLYVHTYTHWNTHASNLLTRRARLPFSFCAFSTSPSSLITSPCKTFSSIKHQFYDDVPQSNLWCAHFFLCCRAFLSINQVPHTHTKFSKVSSTVILHGTCSDTHTFENISPSTTSRPSAPLDHTTSRRSKPCPPLPHHPLQMWEQLVPPPSQSRDEELCITAPRCLREGLGCRV